jgi:hypothetical protein
MQQSHYEENLPHEMADIEPWVGQGFYATKRPNKIDTIVARIHTLSLRLRFTKNNGRRNKL